MILVKILKLQMAYGIAVIDELFKAFNTKLYMAFVELSRIHFILFHGFNTFRNHR